MLSTWIDCCFILWEKEAEKDCYVMAEAWVHAKIDKSQQRKLRTVAVVPEANKQRQLLSRAVKRNPTAQNSFIKWTSNGLVDREYARDSSERLCQQSSYSCIHMRLELNRAQMERKKQQFGACCLQSKRSLSPLSWLSVHFSVRWRLKLEHICILRTSSKHECLCVCTIAHYTGPSHATRHSYGKNIQKTYGNANAYVK